MSEAVIDLFCGAGGLTRGLKDAGLSVSAGYDIDETCRYAYEKNNPGALFKCQSIADTSVGEIVDKFREAGRSILVGCAPCQPFSKYTQGKNTEADEKWGLLREFARLVKGVGPDIVSMENVPELRRHIVFEELLEVLSKNGYYINITEAFCPEFGIPQTRKRLVLLASKLGPIQLINRHVGKAPVTVRDAIYHLPRLAAGESSIDRYHRAARLSPTNLLRIRASKPGGSWRDWPKSLVLECHRTAMGKNYPSVYGRMNWDEPAPTITTQFYGYGNGRYGHPDQDRAISLREGALLQTFPPDYEFLPDHQPASFSVLGRMIGNAVPVRLGEAIGYSIKLHLREFE